MKKIEPIVRKIPPGVDDDRNDLHYWLGRTPDERIEAMTIMREQYFLTHGFDKPPKIEKSFLKRS